MINLIAGLLIFVAGVLLHDPVRRGITFIMNLISGDGVNAG